MEVAREARLPSDTVNALLMSVEGRLAAAVKDNDTVFMQPVIVRDRLPAIERAVLAKVSTRLVRGTSVAVARLHFR